ncbi:NADPH-dependent glutamate synthase [Spirochaeta africana]|uniref:NADPH-dependent glutamate synthase, homotetrameric n=1 Tax=Spirochaeta africana (strain ATCC 700263 / DSM 8902 / Z-7692) TaxID=889378 RepID=H9UMV6_SPIAZ|nr:NADPH-dependent glutamate synthase [Spirochaeta africana]AFG38849.1 NADPH-dependent glutamate synthase, homotetrameric [Spirochaeta africana DSM 8902]
MNNNHTSHTPEDLQQLAQEHLDQLAQIKADTGKIKTKQRLAIPQQEMPAQDPGQRRTNMSEVALGYFEEQALVEAERCLQCKNAPCVAGCPVAIDIPGFIQKITERDYAAAHQIINRTSLLPAVCGRVCPQENQCQAPCTVGKSLKDTFQSVSIGRLERFVADWHAHHRHKNSVDAATKRTEPPAATGKKVGIIGSGPASITAAADLRRAGHEVTMFEAFHKPGGVMMYGIPEFRLPKEIVETEIDDLRRMGVEIRTNFLVGRTRKLTDLLELDGFDALFIGSGAGLPRFMHIEGENLVGVFAANEFLTRSNLMKAYDTSRADTPIRQARKVAVLGGGNVAMDAARTAVRLGAEEVHVIYRRTRTEMPARAEEVDHAEEEGVRFHFLHNPTRIIGDDTSHVCGIELLRHELGEPDDSGRRRPIPVPGSEHLMEVDTVIVSIGNSSNPLLVSSTPGLKTNRWGNIEVDEQCRTSLPKVYAGGDIVLGAATVILAMGQGREAAAAIHADLQ